MNARFGIVAGLIAFVLAACGTTTTPPIGPTVQDGVKSIRLAVRASDGATLEIPDAVKLEIPAGALPKDTVITLAMPEYQTRRSKDLYFEITPSVTLNSPARLVVSTRDLIPEQDAITVQQSSAAQAVQDHGSDLTSFEPSKVVAHDRDADTVTLETTHFTGFAVLNWVDDSAYMVLDIPDAYLKPGDVLITLSAEHPIGSSKNTPNWFPGHVGMVVGRDQFAADAKVVGPNGEAYSGVQAEPNIIESIHLGGVRSGSIALFRSGYENDHLYLGPRTLPAKLNLNDTDRTAVVKFSKEQIGKGYNLVGDGGHFLSTLIAGVTFNKLDIFKLDGFSCVGLIDAAYKSINKSPIKWYDRSILAVTPQDMYKATVPVNSISLKAGDVLEIPVYGTVIAPETKSALGITIQGHYSRERSRTVGQVTSSYSITPENMPADASWTGNANGYVFRWTAKASAKPVVVKFTMIPNANSTRVLDGKPNDHPSPPITQELTINVIP
jgi:hypothetical protein